MGFRNTDADLNELTTPLEKVSTFGENFDAAVGLMIDEESSFSSFLGNENKRKRNDDIKDMISRGEIPETLLYSNSRAADRGYEVNYDKIVRYLNEQPEHQSHPFKTDAELDKERNEMLAQRRAYRNDVFRRAGNSGMAGVLAGSFVAGGVDPINVAATILTPMTAGAKGVSRALYSLHQAKTGALYGATAAAAVEPFVHSWKEEIGAEYTLEDSMINIAASGILDGTINGIAGYVAFRRAELDEVIEDEVIRTEESKPKPEAKPEAKPQEVEEVKPKKKLSLYEQYLLDVEEKNRKLLEAEQAEKPDYHRPMTYEEREEMIVGLTNQGLDLEEAEDIAQFVYESTYHPDQSSSAAKYVDEVETTQERMEVGKPKEDKEPSFGTNDKDSIEEMYENINPEIKAQFDDMEASIDTEIERLKGKLECLNG